MILREAGDAKKNSEYLNKRGVLSKPFPITTIKYIDCSISDIFNHKYNYVIITSPKAIKILDDIVLNNKIGLSKSTNIFAIGLETTVQLNNLGYKNVLNANGDSKFLIEL